MENFRHSPVGEGFFLPAEWEPHQSCWVQWPSRADRWRDLLPKAYTEAAEIIRAIAEFEPVNVIVREEDLGQARFACGRNEAIRFVLHPLDDGWARDTAPMFVTNGEGQIAGIEWQFNGWGNAVHGFGRDAALAGRVLDQERIRKFSGDMVLEAGAISVDGYGTLLTTEECLLNEDRNPELRLSEVEERLALFLGARKVIWLGGGLDADPTTGQVSRVAVFAEREHVLVSETLDPMNLDGATLNDNRVHLELATDAKGQAIKVTGVPLPAGGQVDLDGKPLALNYLDYYVANGAVIMPAYGDSMDDDAAAIVASAFPDRKMVQVSAAVLALGGGAIRRFTQPQPV
jgi:agmatine deiminase